MAVANPEPPSVDASAVATTFLDSLQQASSDVTFFSGLFLPTGWLRDLLCFSWDFRTLSGKEKIAAYLSEPGGDQKTSRLSHSRLSDVTLDDKSTLGPPSVFPVPGAAPGTLGVLAFFRFTLENPARLGRGGVRLIPVPSPNGGPVVWKALTVFLSIQDFKGFEEPTERPLGVHDAHKIPECDVHAQHVKAVEDDPTVLIIGGSQTGLMCAARMGRLGIRSLVVEKSRRFGDVWRHRYPNLTLHTRAHHNSILYHPYPKGFPKFVPKDYVADLLELYARTEGIVGWLSSSVLSDPAPSYDEKKRRWTVQVERVYYLPSGQEERREVIVLKPRHILLATGMGTAYEPSWPGQESFKGEVYHSDVHRDTKKWNGKKAIVVGACNAAADVAQSFLSPEHPAASVNMIQRSATCVISAYTAEKAIYSTSYSEDKDIEDADFLYHSTPHRLSLQVLAGGGTTRLKKLDEDIIEGLNKKGFRMTWELEPGGGEVGLLGFFFERGSGGTMLDFGCAQSIIDGKIKVHGGVNIDHFTQDGIVLTDGTSIAADVVVLCTGNRPVIENAVDIFGPGIREKIPGKRIWGLDPEGEVWSCYRPTYHPGLWCAAGGFPHSRFFSRYLALQILAEEKGLKV